MISNFIDNIFVEYVRAIVSYRHRLFKDSNPEQETL